MGLGLVGFGQGERGSSPRKEKERLSPTDKRNVANIRERIISRKMRRTRKRKEGNRREQKKRGFAKIIFCFCFKIICK